MSRILIPALHTDINGSLIFLAGPIEGAKNWRDSAIKYILSMDNQVTICTPQLPIDADLQELTYKKSKKEFGRIRAWEIHYIDLALKQGSVLFWLPEETFHNCAKPFGGMTRVELGETMASYKYDSSLRFCIGGNPRFPEFNTIKYDLSHYAPREIFDTLEKTCIEALRLAKR